MWRDTRADLVLLQEAAGFAGVSSHVVWQPVRARRWGSAIRVARGQLEPIAVRGFAGWVAGARWLAPHGEALGVFSVHAPHGEGGYCGRMHRIVDAIGAAARRAGTSDIVVGGDFNICISARSHSGTPARERERAVQARLRDELGPDQRVGLAASEGAAGADAALDRQPRRAVPLRRPVRAASTGRARCAAAWC